MCVHLYQCINTNNILIIISYRPSEPCSNEILIDFEPKDPPFRKKNKTLLQKTVSDGEILISEIARSRSREDVEASVSDGEQCYKNLVAASCVSNSTVTVIKYIHKCVNDHEIKREKRG